MPASGITSRVLGLVVALPLLAGACSRPAEPQPDQVYRQFCQAVAAGEWERVLGYLDADSRRALELAAARLAEKAAPGERAALELHRLLRARLPLPLREITTVASAAERVELQVRAGNCSSQQDCRQARVVLVRQGGAWKVKAELPPELARLLDAKEES